MSLFRAAVTATTLVVALIAWPEGPTTPAAAAGPSYPAVSVLGPARLSADQIAVFYASYHKSPKIPVSVKELARYYLDEGAAEGVRGDVAFAQSIVETGWFEFVGSMVDPDDYNYAGIGACDSCSSGNGYPSARAGIRAQIQWLRNYADPTSRHANLARPSLWSAEGYDRFFRKGAAPLWNVMGSGNWATSPTYAEAVLGVYSRMLTFNSLDFSDVRPAAPTLTGFRGVAMNPNGGYYTLAADGTVTAYDGAPDYGSPRFGWDIARDLAVMPDGAGYVVLDGWGGLHRYGSARTALAGLRTPYWRGWDIARSVVLSPSGSGVAVLDGWGGVHARGDAPRSRGLPYWRGWNIARDLAITADGAGYVVLDGWGGLHSSTGVARLRGGPYWRGWDIARSLVVAPDRWAVLDGFGGVHVRDAAGPGPIGYLRADYWRGLAFHAGQWAAVRRDGYLFTS